MTCPSASDISLEILKFMSLSPADKKKKLDKLRKQKEDSSDKLSRSSYNKLKEVSLQSIRKDIAYAENHIASLREMEKLLTPEELDF